MVLRPPPPKLANPDPIPMIGSWPAWWEILPRCGFPNHVVLIDFESYFDADYHLLRHNKGLPTAQYVMDPRWEETGKAIVHVTQPFAEPQAMFWRGDDDSYLEYLKREYGENLDGCTVVSHNLGYDGCVLARRHGITPAHAIDLLGIARHVHPGEHNDLDALTKRYKLLRKGETSQFKGLHLNPKWERTPGKAPKMIHRGMTAEEVEALAAYASHDGMAEWQLFMRMLPKLSRPEVELKLIQHTVVNLTLKPRLKVDVALGESIAKRMDAKVDEALAAVGHTHEEISGNTSFSAILGAALDRAGDKLAKYQKTNKKGQPILAIAKTDEQLEVLKGHVSEEVKKLVTARTSIKSWPNHAKRVRRILAMAEAAGGWLPVPFKYYGAHTGRWSGDELINLQNLGSRGDPLITEVRNVIVAPEGQTLVIVDAAQIEARVLDWISGQNDPVWADPSRDPYCEFASKMSGQRIVNTKKVKQAIKALKDYHDRMRGMGKIGELGCGYGMGAVKAMEYAENSYGVTMDMPTAEKLVKTYRDSKPKVCKFWRVVEQKFKAAARYGEPSTMDRGLKFHKDGDVTVITLPSGRELRYKDVKCSIIDGREQLWMPNHYEPKKRTFMWGGFLTENIVQAISRDILAEGVLNAEQEGIPVPLHVHDEYVGVTFVESAPAVLGAMIRILSKAPEWAAGCPLASEGQISPRYVK